jgi:hypothetical protein
VRAIPVGARRCLAPRLDYSTPTQLKKEAKVSYLTRQLEKLTGSSFKLPPLKYRLFLEQGKRQEREN